MFRKGFKEQVGILAGLQKLEELQGSENIPGRNCVRASGIDPKVGLGTEREQAGWLSKGCWQRRMGCFSKNENHPSIVFSFFLKQNGNMINGTDSTLHELSSLIRHSLWIEEYSCGPPDQATEDGLA